MPVWVAVALAGGVGAVCRYVLDYAITSRGRGVLPWGTFAVNVSGSLGYGVLVGLWLQVGMPETLRIAVAAGFLGAYTTFSTWMYETVRLMEEGAWGVAVSHVVLSVVAGVLAAAGGMWVVRLV
jgi:fluoride exporter